MKSLVAELNLIAAIWFVVLKGYENNPLGGAIILVVSAVFILAISAEPKKE